MHRIGFQRFYCVRLYAYLCHSLCVNKLRERDGLRENLLMEKRAGLGFGVFVLYIQSFLFCMELFTAGPFSNVPFLFVNSILKKINRDTYKSPQFIINIFQFFSNVSGT